jgi:hypothetical protein
MRIDAALHTGLVANEPAFTSSARVASVSSDFESGDNNLVTF